jgi:hypothetical protein
MSLTGINQLHVTCVKIKKWLHALYPITITSLNATYLFTKGLQAVCKR